MSDPVIQSTDVKMEGPGGPGTISSSGPIDQGEKGLAAAGGDDPMGSPPPAYAPKYSESQPTKTGFADIPCEFATPYPPGTEEANAPKVVLEDPSRGSSSMIISDPSKQSIFFRKDAAAATILGRYFEQHEKLWQVPPSICVDRTAHIMLKFYMFKMAETKKWRLNWDRADISVKISRAAKGQQRSGPGSSRSWEFQVGRVPPYYDPDYQKDINKQISSLMDFARDRCMIPEHFWANENYNPQDPKNKEQEASRQREMKEQGGET